MSELYDPVADRQLCPACGGYIVWPGSLASEGYCEDCGEEVDEDDYEDD